MALQVFVKSRGYQAGQPSGDAFWYSQEPQHVWLMVVDGLGSGPEAAVPALAAVECVRRHVERHPTPHHPAAAIETVMFDCDQALRGTRGAAMGLCILDAKVGQGWYGGVGNVEMRSIGLRPSHPTNQAGIVGAGVPKMRVEPFAYQAGDLVIMHSDGLSSRFTVTEQMARCWSLESVGQRLVDEHARTHDDMTLVLMRQHA